MGGDKGGGGVGGDGRMAESGSEAWGGVGFGREGGRVAVEEGRAVVRGVRR